MFVYPHGFTDIWDYSPQQILFAYGVSFAVATACVQLKNTFLVLSALHFARDGWLGWVIVPAFVLCDRVASFFVGLQLFVFYMFFVHLPNHYAAGITPVAACFVLAAGVLFVWFDFSPFDYPKLSRGAVIGHIILRYV